MSKTIDAPESLTDWLNILDTMGKSVAAAIQSVDRQEPHAPHENAIPAGQRDAALREQLDETLCGLEERLDLARALASRIEDMLDRDEREVRAWRATADAARERLAPSGQLS